MPLTSLNPVIVVALLGWTFFLTRRAQLGRETGTAALLFASLLLAALGRIPFMAESEANVDASTWLAAAFTVVQRADPLWTLLTYSDSRPLTVLPLAVALWLGAPPAYVVAETIGLLFALGTIVVTYRLLRLEARPSVALLGVWTLALFYATTGYGDHVAYNSEAFAVFLVTVATLGALLLARRASCSPRLAGALGVLVGLFPYEKMQIVPVGLALGVFMAAVLLRRRAWRAVGALLLGAIVPTIFVGGWFALRGEWTYFWDTYFWRYYYYSYSEEFSSMAVAFRFRPGRIARYIFGNGWSALYVVGLVTVIFLGGLALLRGARAQISPASRQNLGLGAVLLALMLYAVLQAGNNYEHYILLLLVPLLHLAWGLAGHAPAPWRHVMLAVGLGTATLQAAHNAWWRAPVVPGQLARADARIAASLLRHSAPGEPIVVWGYADRFHVLARRPMGYRYANTYYVYDPLVALQELDRRHFRQDLEHHRAALFVDAMLPAISPFGGAGYPHDHDPQVAAYIAAHYTLVDTADRVRIYRRNDRPSRPGNRPE